MQVLFQKIKKSALFSFNKYFPIAHFGRVSHQKNPGVAENREQQSCTTLCNPISLASVSRTARLNNTEGRYISRRKRLYEWSRGGAPTATAPGANSKNQAWALVSRASCGVAFIIYYERHDWNLGCCFFQADPLFLAPHVNEKPGWSRFYVDCALFLSFLFSDDRAGCGLELAR